MKKSGWLPALLIAFTVPLLFAAPALGLTVSIDNPDAAYLARTAKLDYSAIAEGMPVASLTDGNLTVEFTPAVQTARAFAHAWGVVGQVEDTSVGLPLLWSFTETSVTMHLDRPVYEFGFEGANNITENPQDLTATFVVSNDGDALATITKAITATNADMNVHARLFAIRSEVPFDEIQVTTNAPGGLIMAQLRYSETPPPLVTVSGVVRGASTGVGVPFARVAIEHSGGAVAEVEADVRGRYSVKLLPGVYQCYVTGPGWSEVNEEVTVPEASPFSKDFELTDHHQQAVYRFFNRSAGVHFYTANDAEFINTLTNLASTFTYDGIAYFVSVGADPDGIPLYRFYNRKVGVHFYTASEAEKADVIAKHSDRYSYEGIAYQVRSDGVGSAVYRYYVPARNTHFYTADTSEISLSSGLSNRYHYEGVAYFVGGLR